MIRPELQQANEMLEATVRLAAEMGASDIHIEPGEAGLRIRCRVDGALREMGKIPRVHAAPLVNRVKILSGLDALEKRRPQDGQLRFGANGSPAIDLRVSAVPSAHGEKLVLRLLDPARCQPGLEGLGLEREQAGRVCRMASGRGLVLVVGPTGSGKTTTIYRIVSVLDRSRLNVVTLEDPVESTLEGVTQINVDPDRGLGFASGLRAVLRQDPDVIVIGEIRDADTAATAVRAAVTGHLVIASMHARNPVGALLRLVDMGIQPHLVSEALAAVIAQRLLRRVCPDCRADYEPDEAERNFLEAGNVPWTGGASSFARGEGCERCMDSGYLGRVGVFEVASATPAASAATLGRILRGDVEEGLTVEEGVMSLREAGCLKAYRGETTIWEVMRWCLG